MAPPPGKCDPVSAAAIVTETIKREERSIRLNTEFKIHSHHHVATVADKPNQVVPSQQPTEAQLQAAHDTLAALANFQHLEQTPNQIHTLPATTNQAYGFFTTPAAQAPNPMFQHSKGHCDVTRYAADYYALRGEHLFAKAGTGSGGKDSSSKVGSGGKGSGSGGGSKATKS